MRQICAVETGERNSDLLYLFSYFDLSNRPAAISVIQHFLRAEQINERVAWYKYFYFGKSLSAGHLLSVGGKWKV